MSLCSLLNISRKGVQAARISGPLSSPADSLFPSAETEIGGIFVSNTLNTPKFKVARDGGGGPICFCSACLLGPKAHPDNRTSGCETSH